MGIDKNSRLFEKASINAIRLSYTHMKMCELGDQTITDFDSTRPYRTISAKLFYSALGAQHTSIDLNGKDGALVINLDNPIPDYLLNSFDLVTNYGTTEHVNNQFQVFKNIHEMTRSNGVIIHALPPVGQWPNHCRYYYSKAFFIQLAKLCNYELINLKIVKSSADTDYNSQNDLLMVAFLKTGDDFIGKDQFNKLPILDTGDLRFTDNYTTYFRGFTEQIRTLIGPRPNLGIFIMSHPRLSACARMVFRNSLQLAESIKKRFINLNAMI